MVLALVSHNTLIEKIEKMVWKYVECLNGISIGISHNTLIEKIWKYVECLNGISIGISQYTHKRKYGNMLNV